MRFLVTALLLLAACDTTDPCGEPTYGGKASDEAWLTILDGERSVKLDDAKAAQVTVPTEGQVFYAAAGAPKITWTSPLQAMRHQPSRSLWATVRGWFIADAWAHLPPVSGAIHRVEISIPGEQCPVRTLTTELEWTIEPAGWERLKAAEGKTLELIITSAYLRENAITEGPFRRTTLRKLKVGP
jgi:hypothetical protein